MAEVKRAKGTAQLNASVTTELLEEFKEFCESRGESLRHHLEAAMRRHLDNPPPPPQPVALPPLPPVPPPTATTARKGAKGKGKT